MSELEKHILKHAIGMQESDSDVPDEPHRNRFVTGPDGGDFDACTALVSRGLMGVRSLPAELYDGMSLFFVTEEGMELLRGGL
jgi:hypothetical protein